MKASPSKEKFTKMRKRFLYNVKGHNSSPVNDGAAIIANQVTYMRYSQLESIRLDLKRVNKTFNIKFYPAINIPVTKKAEGLKMGGGKGGVTHHVGIVKTGGRVLAILNNDIDPEIIKKALEKACYKLPKKDGKTYNVIFSENLKNK